MNRNPDTSGLKRGNTTNVGRKPAETLRRRQEILDDLAAAASQPQDSVATTVHYAAIQALATLIKANDSPTIRWYWDQQMGRAPAITDLVIAEIDVFVALGNILPRHLPDEQQREYFLNDLQQKLSR